MSTPTDLIDAAVPLDANDPLHAVRQQRDKVVHASQGSYAAVFDPELPGLGLAERLLAAQTVATLSGGASLAAHYGERLAALSAPAPAGARLDAILHFSRVLALRPIDGDKTLLLTLPAAGLSSAEVVTLAQLIAFVAYQVRVVAGLQALVLDSGASATTADVAVQAEAAAFVHPANLPKPGEPVRVNGYTSETLDWKAWLPVLDLAQASALQLEVLKASHPKATSSDYYLTLVQQPRILQERSIAFNAIMYSAGGLSRAERELASTVVSRINGCVYCASVHAQRFEQLAKRNDVIAQLFQEPEGAGSTARERAIVDASIALTRDPAGFATAPLQGLRAAGLGTLEILDLVHAIAIFAWANRLMLNLGEPIYAA